MSVADIDVGNGIRVDCEFVGESRIQRCWGVHCGVYRSLSHGTLVGRSAIPRIPLTDLDLDDGLQVGHSLEWYHICTPSRVTSRSNSIDDFRVDVEYLVFQKWKSLYHHLGPCHVEFKSLSRKLAGFVREKK